jgi:hybrid cluster-associated redox disulfide protein
LTQLFDLWYNKPKKSKKRKDRKMKVTKETLIGDVLDFNVETAKFFFEIGMHCLGCPHSRGESIADACQVHGTDADALVAKLNAFLGE